jgi:hypothetical protein
MIAFEYTSDESFPLTGLGLVQEERVPAWEGFLHSLAIRLIGLLSGKINIRVTLSLSGVTALTVRFGGVRAKQPPNLELHKYRADPQIGLATASQTYLLLKLSLNTLRLQFLMQTVLDSLLKNPPAESSKTWLAGATNL